MLVSWRGPACLAGTSPIPPTLSGTRKRALRAAPLSARGYGGPAPPPPTARPARGRSTPQPPLAPSGPERKLIKVGGRGRSVGSRCALRACGRRNQRLCGLHCRALSWGRSAPHPPRDTHPRKRLGFRLRAVPRRAPLAHPAACAAAAPVASPRAAAGSLSRGSSGNRAAFSGCIVGPGVAARLSPAQLAGPAGFPFLLHFFSFRLANICSIWYNCIGRFCL